MAADADPGDFAPLPRRSPRRRQIVTSVSPTEAVDLVTVRCLLRGFVLRPVPDFFRDFVEVRRCLSFVAVFATAGFSCRSGFPA
jgi:hypothetical protein